MTAIETRNLTKEFNGTTAVNNLSFSVDQGEICGFLGPNGAGKTTTIRILLNLLRPTSGSASVLGRDVQHDGPAIRQHVGVLAENHGLWPRLTPRHHIHLIAKTKGVTVDPTSVLDRVGIANVIEDRVGTFSNGMRQRLALAMAVVGEPKVLLLDEPSQGLDPHGTHRLRDIIREENERGATVFFSSHNLDQVERICDTVCLINHGELTVHDSVDEVIADGDDLETIFREHTTPGEIAKR